MTTPLSTVYIDLVGPAVNAAWLNAVGQALLSTATPTTIVATSGQTIFTVPSGSANEVYINGVYQILNSSYIRTNDTTITFSEAVPVTAKVTIL